MSALPVIHELIDPVSKAAELADQFLRQPSRSGGFPVEELRALAEAGLLKLTLPQKQGGCGIGRSPGSSASLLHVLKEIGRGNLSLGRVFEGHINALLLVERFGFPSQTAAAAESVVRCDSVFGVWNTGPEGSPKLTPLSSGALELTGSKTFATGAARIQQAIVTAALPDGGWQMCLVPLEQNGIAVHADSWNPLGMEASESYTVVFSGIRLTNNALIGDPGDYYSEPFFSAGAFRFCAVQLGGAQALFDSCCVWVRSSARSGDPFQLQRIAEMAVLVESGRHWLRQAAEWMEDSLDPQRMRACAQMTRIAVEGICTRVIELTTLTVGARGLAHAEPFSRTLRDLQMYLRQAGFDAAFQTVARDVLDDRFSHD